MGKKCIELTEVGISSITAFSFVSDRALRGLWLKWHKEIELGGDQLKGVQCREQTF